ncbi:hypothetical protein [Halorussus halobius]|uniref:hypothetical protein n=1 Tax=Halorussus halobius TaxID=1710537 RepID=UPI001092172D|nr:hypothetical protein [Halorussus halobius]
MALPRADSPLARDVLVGLLAVGLVAGPLWTAAIGLGGPTYTYDRAEVVTTDEGIEYAGEADLPPGTPLSEDIECAGWGGDLRACSFERHLLDEGWIPTGVYFSNPDHTPTFSTYSADYYEYVQLDGTLYEPTHVTNESAPRGDGLYRVDARLERADPAEALERESLDVNRDDLASVTVETARNGETTSRREVDVPDTPIRLDDGSYYRVYRERVTDDPSWIETFVTWVLTYVGPLYGLSLLVRLAGRVEVTYHGDRR